ncbi:MAG: hypothetical protein A4E39_00027 [Methanoregulaceae archaeon PtaB.Bin152]|nr:MAG: hypothetical protein A4E39_00027 [Methanoregulaceae archaeon PtaB.Bin152]
MFGYLREARSSAMRCRLFPAVMRLTPILMDLRARTYRDLRLPPRRTFTLTITMPCLAL